MTIIQDIHHLSAIVGDPQETYDFYSQVLGLRLVKQTVNFDDPHTYHLYFARQDGQPEGAMTFFNWPQADAKEGVVGSGQVGRIAFRIPLDSLSYWQDRLTQHGVDYQLTQLFGQDTLEFTDTHGLALALVEGKEAKDQPIIDGFHGTVLLSKYPQDSGQDLEDFLGLSFLYEEEGHLHYETAGEKRHRILIPTDPLPIRRLGIGTVHHVAWAVEDDETLRQMEDALNKREGRHSGYKDRKYFHSLYYREVGKIVFEIATQGPGFTVDEALDELGKALQLPAQYEGMREDIEKNLPPIQLKEE